MVYVMLFFNKGVAGDGEAYAEGVDREPRLLTSESLFLKIAESGLLYFKGICGHM